MKRKAGYILLIIFVILLSACGKKGPTWQEQYDLGMKYLNTGDYEEAVMAFQVAISIDPKQQPAYIGAADAYVGMAGSGEESIDADKCYAAAEENYRKALDIDSETEEVYEKFANMYVESGNTEKAEELIAEAKDKGQEGTWVDELLSKLDSQEPAQEESGQQATEETDTSDQAWKLAYMNYIDQKKMEIEGDPIYNNDTVYKLLDINGDELPELYIDNRTDTWSGEVCTYINGQVIPQDVISGSTWYIEGENLFMTELSRQGESMESIYQIEDGGIIEIENGSFDRSRATRIFDGQNVSDMYDYDSIKAVISNY